MILAVLVFPIPGGPLNRTALALTLGRFSKLTPLLNGTYFLLPLIWTSSQSLSQTSRSLIIPLLPTKSLISLGAYKSVHISVLMIPSWFPSIFMLSRFSFNAYSRPAVSEALAISVALYSPNIKFLSPDFSLTNASNSYSLTIGIFLDLALAYLDPCSGVLPSSNL